MTGTEAIERIKQQYPKYDMPDREAFVSEKAWHMEHMARWQENNKSSILREAACLRACGVDLNRVIARDVADFYLLEWLHSHGLHATTFSQLSAHLSVQYLRYLDTIVGGEARHAAAYILDHAPVDRPLSILVPYSEAVTDMSRKWTWVVWMLGFPHGADYLRAAAYAFDKDVWLEDRWDGTRSASVCGPMWATVAKVAADAKSGLLKPRTFVDRCFTLEHNNSNVFDKGYSIVGLKDALEIQASGNYDRLADYASEGVREKWLDFQESKGYDEGWLGVQRIRPDGSSERRLAWQAAKRWSPDL